jgi:hypothetical protein
MAGKMALVVAVSAFSGYLYHLDVLAGNARAFSLTLLEYTADFDKYKAGLIQPEWPLWGHIGLFLFMAGGFFGVYEATGWALGWLMGRFLPQPATEKDASVQSVGG